MSQPIAVITGASSGIGAACVDGFSSAGYQTLGVDIESRSEADEHIVIDLAAPSCGDELALAIGDRAVGVLVNNAAISADVPILDSTVELWDRVMAVNLRAPFLLSQALHSALTANGGGVIVNVASVHALATSPSAAVYAASKGGLAALTRAMAVEWAPTVRANAVLPGAVDTAMLGAGLQRSQQTIEEMGNRHPLGRVASPGEIARVVRFVAVEGTFMTGSAVVVDGGVLSRLSSE